MWSWACTRSTPHQTNSESDQLIETLYKGGLNKQQNATISQIAIALRDDSPEDGTGGAAFFPDASDVIITYRDGTVESGRDIRFGPVISGGLERQGFLTADGDGQISLLYDFDSASFVNRASADKSEIAAIEFRLVLANDYQIWMSSDQQLGEGGGFVTVGRPSSSFTWTGERSISLGDVFGADVDDPVFLLVAQAEGNVQDISNLRTVRFAYGLPTATTIAGATLKVEDVFGLRSVWRIRPELEFPQVSQCRRGDAHFLCGHWRSAQRTGVDGELEQALGAAVPVWGSVFD